MSKGNKTIKVKPLLDWANRQLARKDEYATQEFKSGIATMIEQVLHQSRNYKGFRFLEEGDNKVGSKDYYSRYYFIKD